MTQPDPDSSETRRLLDSCSTGGDQAFGRLFERRRPYLREVVVLRLDSLLRARLDPSDILQEVHLEAARRLPDYLQHRPLSFRLWLRQFTQDRLVMARRQHVEAARRSIARELPLPEESSRNLAAHLLVARGQSPSEEVVQQEMGQKVRQALARLPEADQEILLLINFEGLNSTEAGQVLGIDPATLRKRYGRALLKLQKILRELGFPESHA
jgi:RNA polymerase sigma-70 factor (ECF subfamily)